MTPQGFRDTQSLGTIQSVFHSHRQGSRSNLQGTGRWGCEEKECPSQGNSPHLLAILMLQVQPSLDVASGLLKGLALRHFSRVVCADPDDIGAEEEHHVSTQLQKGGWQG